MLDGGVYLPPSPFEAWFVSAAHDDEAVEPGSPPRCPPAARAAAGRPGPDAAPAPAVGPGPHEAGPATSNRYLM